MTDKSVSQVLREAADLLEKPGAWTQGVLARDARDHATFDERKACSFCADGALRMIGTGDLTKPYEPGLRVLRKLIRREVGTWNDRNCRSAPQVAAKLREAADLAEASS